MGALPRLSSFAVTARSRRLRTAGLALLVTIVILSTYGVLFLMPTIARQSHMVAATGYTAGAVKRLSGNARRVALTELLVAYAYWSACGVMVIALLIVAWLDFREVTRFYMDQRIALWREAANRFGAAGRDE